MSSRADARSRATASKPTLSVKELNLLLLLDTAGVKSYSKLTGEVEWLLSAEDVGSLVELAFSLFSEWQPHSPLDAFNRTARLLGISTLPED